MRILILADIHANGAALAAIQEPFDACLCLGDLVEYGPNAPCVMDWVRKHATHTVRGNHDHGTAQAVDIFGAGGFRYLTMATRAATIQSLTAADRRYLGTLPTLLMVTIAGKRFVLVHATPRDPLDEYCPADPAHWAPRIAQLEADYVCVGHTHQAFQLQVGSTTVINPGSVGLQRDGNPQARYAVLDTDTNTITLKSVAYDIEATIAALNQFPIEDRARAMLADVYRYGRLTPLTGMISGSGTGTPTNATRLGKVSA
ncbi:MAG: metallophosphoesterase family protein [Gemmataceae bacterium]